MLERRPMTVRIRLPGGTLKLKRRQELRRREKSGAVPVWQIGNYFLVWWPSSIPNKPSKTTGGDEPD
jgi:hypothetical protein